MNEELRKAVKQMLAALDGGDYPKDGITSHFGKSTKVGPFSVNFSCHGKSLLVTVYGRRNIDFFPVQTHRENLAAVEAGAASKMIKTWNGEDGHYGISIVLERPTPASLITTIGNYKSLPNVFEKTEEENARFKKFNQWFEQRLSQEAL